MKNTRVLSLKNLTKRFGTVVANNSVNIDLYRGEVLSLLGENGAGKTTLMNMLFGHYVPDNGSIDVLGEDGKMEPLTLGHPQASLDAVLEWFTSILLWLKILQFLITSF